MVFTHALDCTEFIVDRPTSVTLPTGVKQAGHQLTNDVYFDTLHILPKDLQALKAAARAKEINLRYFEDGSVGVTLDDTVEEKDINDLLEIFGCNKKAVSIVDLLYLQISVHFVFNSSILYIFLSF